MKQKYKLGQDVWIIRHDTKNCCYKIIKGEVCAVEYSNDMSRCNTPMSFDIFYNIQYWDEHDSLCIETHILQTKVFCSYQSAKRYVMNNFDSFFLRI